MDFRLQQRVLLLIRSTRALMSSIWGTPDQVWREKLEEAESQLKRGNGPEAVRLLEEINNGWLVKQQIQ